MTTIKREKYTALQRVRRLILGKNKPNLATRISVGIGFLIWVYLASWQILTFLALTLMSSLAQYEDLKNAFNRVGNKLYHYEGNTLELLTLHNIVQLVAYLIVLIALILIYRRKRIGFLIYIFGNVSIILSTLLIMKMKYFQYEMSYLYVILIGSTTLYFGIGALWFYRWKPKKEEENSFTPEEV
ncbi:MAG: hypothetical protein HUJ25_00595 [Crocinitomicaceae bacterium]|nr:hypothetical protein [Crocinitomicaceae bacterium]